MRLAVIGTGLIGASVGMAATRVGATVSGFDQDDATAAVALQRGAVDEVKASLGEALGGADLAGEREAERAALLEAQGYGVVVAPALDE